MPYYKNAVPITALLLSFTSSEMAHSEQQLNTQPMEQVSIIGSKVEDRETLPGAGYVVGHDELLRDKYDDVQRVLASVPGVYVRGEDGYGLRPNIGLRGSTTERSRKIALLEDGVLIAPAPYSAPSAYYFPIISRMSAVEVVKGPAAISQGPNTVGGVVNLITQPLSFDQQGIVDLTVGQDDYTKLYGLYSDSSDTYAWLVEGLHMQTSGFKTLTNRADTGFEKNNMMLKTRWNTPLSSDTYHEINMKVNFSTETSNETYLGLSDADYRNNPYQRYAASQDDLMEWTHYQLQLSHTVEVNEVSSLTTQLYRHQFNRDWNKLNHLGADESLSQILADPNSGNNRRYMQILAGKKDTEFNDETLFIGNNGRKYLSQGIQSTVTTEIDTGKWQHNFLAGLRFHYDEIKRNHTEDTFSMISGNTVETGDATLTTTRNTEDANAIALFVKDDIKRGKLALSAGIRYETISYNSHNRLTDTSTKNTNDVIIPGAGIFYQLTPNLGLLAGAHKGYVPTGPGQANNIDPEESINYELGIRFKRQQTNMEVIGYFNDYKNLNGICTFSSSCAASSGEVTNAGEVDIFGIESMFNHIFFMGNGTSVPLSLTYTYTQTRFRSDFESEFPLWRNVQKGDEVPYMPNHQVAFSIGIEREKWDMNTNIRYASSQVEQAGIGGDLDDVTLKSYTVVDLTGSYYHSQRSTFYGKIDNVLDSDHMVSRRPYGARPTKPMTVALGYRYEF